MGIDEDKPAKKPRRAAKPKRARRKKKLGASRRGKKGRNGASKFAAQVTRLKEQRAKIDEKLAALVAGFAE